MLQAQGLAYTRRGESQPAFAAVDFSVAPGEAVAFVGQAAAALHGVLSGLRRDYRGALRFQGREYAEWGRDFYERVGVGFAQPRLHGGLTVAETLAAYADLYPRGRAYGAGWLARLGMEGLQGRRVGRLAGGERKLLSLVLAFAHAPEAVFLEEPLEGLDLPEARRLMACLREEKRPERAFIVCTSDETAGKDFFDRIVRLP